MRPYMSDQNNSVTLLGEITGPVTKETAMDVSYHDFSKTFVCFLYYPYNSVDKIWME